MSPQSEGRPSIDGRAVGGVSLTTGGADQLEGYNSNTPSTLPRSNGYDAQDGQMSRSKFAGPAAGNGNDSTHSTPADGRIGREKEYTGNIPIRDRSRTNGSAGGKTSSGTLRLCKKCNEPLTGQFVRALGGTFHLDCFKCRVSLVESGQRI